MVSFPLQTFYWTDSKTFFFDEFTKQSKAYAHNYLLFFTPPYNSVCLDDPSTQPAPGKLSTMTLYYFLNSFV